MPEKVDLRRSLDCYRAQAGRFRLVDVPRLQHLTIDGHGDPNQEAFAVAVRALYPLAYALKQASTRELDRDYAVMPLEGLWLGTTSGSSGATRAGACRRSMSARSTTRPRRSRGCTTSGSQGEGSR